MSTTQMRIPVEEMIFNGPDAPGWLSSVRANRALREAAIQADFLIWSHYDEAAKMLGRPLWKKIVNPWVCPEFSIQPNDPLRDTFRWVWVSRHRPVMLHDAYSGHGTLKESGRSWGVLCERRGTYIDVCHHSEGYMRRIHQDHVIVGGVM